MALFWLLPLHSFSLIVGAGQSESSAEQRDPCVCKHPLNRGLISVLNRQRDNIFSSRFFSSWLTWLVWKQKLRGKKKMSGLNWREKKTLSDFQTYINALHGSHKKHKHLTSTQTCQQQAVWQPKQPNARYSVALTASLRTLMFYGSHTEYQVYIIYVVFSLLAVHFQHVGSTPGRARWKHSTSVGSEHVISVSISWSSVLSCLGAGKGLLLGLKYQSKNIFSHTEDKMHPGFNMCASFCTQT